MKKIIGILCAAAIVISSVSTLAFAVDTSYKPYEDSRYFEYGDYDIHYRVVPAKGERKGRIMMLHGFLCSTYTWRNMVPLFAQAGYDCVMADLPNFGFSTRESDEITIVERETLIVELMKSIAPVDEWIVAGHSMGGGVATNIAIENPVDALLLYCPAPQSEFPEAMEGIMTSGIMKGIMNAFFKYGTKIDILVKFIIFAATMDWDFSMNYDVSGVTDAVQYDGFGGGMCEMMYSVKATDLANADKVKCPVLICQASQDIIINDTMKTQMHEAFPDAATYVVEGGGHQCIENRADELCKVTLDFIDENL